MVTAIVLVKTDVARIPETGEAIAQIPQVTEVYSVTGEFDLVAMVRVRKHEELGDVIPGTLNRVPGVTHTETHIAFRTYSRHDLEAAFAIGYPEQPENPGRRPTRSRCSRRRVRLDPRRVRQLATCSAVAAAAACQMRHRLAATCQLRSGREALAGRGPAIKKCQSRAGVERTRRTLVAALQRGRSSSGPWPPSAAASAAAAFSSTCPAPDRARRRAPRGPRLRCAARRRPAGPPAWTGRCRAPPDRT